VAPDVALPRNDDVMYDGRSRQVRNMPPAPWRHVHPIAFA
jgi:hypothetical protein